MRCVWLPIHSGRHEAVGEAISGASLFRSDHQLESALSEPTGDERNAERSTATASPSTRQTYTRLWLTSLTDHAPPDSKHVSASDVVSGCVVGIPPIIQVGEGYAATIGAGDGDMYGGDQNRSV